MNLSEQKPVVIGIGAFSALVPYFLGYFSFCTTLIAAAVLAYLINFALSDSDLTLQILEKYGRSKENLRGKVVWITGASTGIGEGLALKLAKVQCKLVLSARSQDKLDNLRKKCIEIGKYKSEDVLVVAFDMLDYDYHEKAFDTVIKHFKKIDILVSNAGASQRAAWTNITTDVDKDIFNLNVFSLISLARIVTRHFLKVGGGHHVVTSSLTGKMGMPLSSSYSASKHALVGYFESLRTEHATDGISITLLSIGPVHSNLMALAYGESLDSRGFPKRKETVMTTERCADLIVASTANQLPDVVISIQPALLLCYVAIYFTTFYQWAQKVLNMKKIITSARSQNEKGE